MQKIKGHPDLVKAPNGAILNVNQGKLERVKSVRKRQKAKDDKINTLEARIETLEKLINGQ